MERDGVRTLTFDEIDHLRELVGELGAHLDMIGRAFGVVVRQRGSEIAVESLEGGGGPDEVEQAVAVLQQLYELVGEGHQLGTADVHHAIRILDANPGARLATFFNDAVLVNLDGRPISPRSAGQRAYVQALRDHELVFGVGPAGTGKTYLAMAMAVAALKRGDVRRIILTRPAVEAGEKLGFLPGDLAEKVDPYLRPLFDALQDMVPADRVARMMEKRVIEVAPLAFMRGRTLAHAYVVLDEAQNTTVEQMKMFLTRMGDGSRMVITGDVTQIDLPRKQESGMVRALDILGDVDEVGVVHLGTADVVRHAMVARVIGAWARHDAAREAHREALRAARGADPRQRRDEPPAPGGPDDGDPR